MTKQNPEQIEANISKFVYDEALHQASCSSAPQDVAAATAAILQAAFIMATADLSLERRAGMFMENKSEYLLRAEIAELRAALETLDKWKKKGDALVKKGDSMGAMFCLGQWWADRPWRDK